MLNATDCLAEAFALGAGGLAFSSFGSSPLVAGSFLVEKRLLKGGMVSDYEQSMLGNGYCNRSGCQCYNKGVVRTLRFDEAWNITRRDFGMAGRNLAQSRPANRNCSFGLRPGIHNWS